MLFNRMATLSASIDESIRVSRGRNVGNKLKTGRFVFASVIRMVGNDGNFAIHVATR